MQARHVATGSHRFVEGMGATRKPRSRLARRAALALATAALATAALAAPAQADTTIGQTGGDTPCPGADLRADTNYVVPAGRGTITSFSYQSAAADAGEQLDFLVLRPAGGSNYTGIGKTGLVTLAGTGAVETFAADIDVQGGDILGFYHGGELLTACERVVASGGGIRPDTVTDPSVGDTVSFPFSNTVLDLNLSANLDTTPTPTIADLIASVEGIDLPHGIENALLKKLTAAQRNLDAEDLVGACDKLASFINQVSAQSGKKIDADDAEGLIDQAEAVRADSLSCA